MQLAEVAGKVRKVVKRMMMMMVMMLEAAVAAAAGVDGGDGHLPDGDDEVAPQVKVVFRCARVCGLCALGPIASLLAYQVQFVANKMTADISKGLICDSLIADCRLMLDAKSFSRVAAW